MNTPSPCDRCKHLYVDTFAQDDPSYSAECWKDLPLGNLNCPLFEDWKQAKDPLKINAELRRKK